MNKFEEISPDEISKKKLRIGFYSHSLPPEVDGVSTRFRDILNEYDKQGHECIVFSLRKDIIQYSTKFKYYALEYSTTQAYSNKKFGSPYLNNFLKIYNNIKNENIDVIHCVSDGTTPLFIIIGMLLQIPVVISIHTDVVAYFSKFGFPKMFNTLANYKDVQETKYADSVATTSESFRNKLADRGVYCNHIVKSGVDTFLFNKNKFNKKLRDKLMFGNGNNDEYLLCTFVGRFSSEKGIINLINWITQVPNVYLALIGNGPLANDLKKFHGNNNKIYCKPEFVNSDMVAQIFASSDIHVSGSTTETLGNTVLEAFACGIPVIVPNAAGFKNTVNHNKNGYLYDNNNDAIKYLKLLQNDRKLLKKFGQNALKKSNNYSIPVAAQDYIDWYLDTIENQKSKSYASLIFMGLHTLLAIFAWVVFFVFCPNTNIIQKQKTRKMRKKRVKKIIRNID